MPLGAPGHAPAPRDRHRRPPPEKPLYPQAWPRARAPRARRCTLGVTARPGPPPPRAPAALARQSPAGQRAPHGPAADARGRARPPARARRAAPTGPRTRSRSSPAAGRARLRPQRAPEASGAPRQRPGAPPWSSEASPQAAGRGAGLWGRPRWPSGVVVQGFAPRADWRAPQTTSPTRPYGCACRDS